MEGLLNGVFGEFVAQLFAGLLGLLLSVIGVLATKALQKYLAAQDFEKLKALAEFVVRYVEQVANSAGLDNVARKSAAMTMLIELRDKYKLPFDNDTLDAMIEAFVQAIKAPKVELEVPVIPDGEG